MLWFGAALDGTIGGSGAALDGMIGCGDGAALDGMISGSHKAAAIILYVIRE